MTAKALASFGTAGIVIVLLAARQASTGRPGDGLIPSALKPGALQGVPGSFSKRPPSPASSELGDQDAAAFSAVTGFPTPEPDFNHPLVDTPLSMVAGLFLDSTPEEQEEILAGLKRSATKSVDDETRLRCSEILAAIGTTASVQTLVELVLECTDSDTKAALASGLRAFSAADPAAREVVTSIIAYCEDEVLVAEATAAVTRFADPDTLQHLQELYCEPEATPEVSGKIIETVTALNDPALTEYVAILAGEADGLLRNAAASALGSQGTPEAVTFLLDQASSSAHDPDALEPWLVGIRSINQPQFASVLQVAAETSPCSQVREAALAALQGMPRD